MSRLTHIGCAECCECVRVSASVYFYTIIYWNNKFAFTIFINPWTTSNTTHKRHTRHKNKVIRRQSFKITSEEKLVSAQQFHNKQYRLFVGKCLGIVEISWHTSHSIIITRHCCNPSQITRKLIENCARNDSSTNIANLHSLAVLFRIRKYAVQLQFT